LNPVLEPGEAGDWDTIIWGSSVVYDGSIFHMWYNGGIIRDKDFYDIGYATSKDGSIWTKCNNNPVMKKGSPGSWDDRSVYSPSVIDSAGIKYKMWYSGRYARPTGPIRVGIAESRIPPWKQMKTMDEAKGVERE